MKTVGLRRPMRSLFKGVAAGALGVLSLCANAEGVRRNEAELVLRRSEPHGPSAAELRLLPPYCKVRLTQGTNRKNPEVTKWIRALGPSYVDIHHYCIGLNLLNRANNTFGGSKQDLAHKLRGAIGNFDYVLDRASPGFALLPEIHLNRARAFRKGGRPHDAATDLDRALELKPDYAAGYAELSDLYRQTGEHDRARKVLEQGLAMKPESRALRIRLAKLSQATPKPTTF